MSLTKEILSECFGIRNYEIKNIVSEESRTIFELERIGSSYCSLCGNVCGRYDSKIREFLIGSLNLKAIYARVKIYRVRCPICEAIIRELHDLSEGKNRYSKPVGSMMVRFTELLDNEAVSRLLGVSPATIFRIDNSELSEMEQRYVKDVPKAKILSVDEVAYKRRHNYASVVTDYDNAKVLWLAQGRKQEDLVSAYDKLSAGLQDVSVVTMDFWKAFENATRQKIPKAKIIYDRFHIARLLNRAVESERRSYQKELSNDERQQIKRHSRWVLLKRQPNLNQTNKDHLEELKQANERLFVLYLLKEDFLQIFDNAFNIKIARKELFAWIRHIFNSDFSFLKRFARSILKRIRNILVWFNNPISNAKAEGINNVIKTLLKRAYGYKNFDYFRRKVLQKCGYLMNYATHTF